MICKNILPFEIDEQLVDAVQEAEIALMERVAEINDAVLKEAANAVDVMVADKEMGKGMP